MIGKLGTLTMVLSFSICRLARGVQRLRATAIELQMTPIRSSINIPVAALWAHFQGEDVDKELTELATAALALIEDLLWWTAALKAARTHS
jgi:hypothetical protein